MIKLVKVKSGSYRNNPIVDVVFPMIKPAQVGAKGMFITVDASALLGADKDRIRVTVKNEDALEYMGADGEISSTFEQYPVVEVAPRKVETDEEAIERIRNKFEILNIMSEAVAEGTVRGLIVSGPPGVGKSFGIEKVLETHEAMNKLRNGAKKTEIVKGSMTPIGLYQVLYNNSSRGDILVFDDCDVVLFDDVCLNMLKAVLDSGKKRIVSWKAESNALRREGIPDQFEFKAGIVFITNLKFDQVRSKKIATHLEALQSRCHYIDLEMDSMRDRFLRINQIVGDGMLEEYNFGADGDQEVIDFMVLHSARLQEISLRMVLKIADLKKMSEKNWQMLAENTCMKRVSL